MVRNEMIRNEIQKHVDELHSIAVGAPTKRPIPDPAAIGGGPETIYEYADELHAGITDGLAELQLVGVCSINARRIWVSWTRPLLQTEAQLTVGLWSF